MSEQKIETGGAASGPSLQIEGRAAGRLMPGPLRVFFGLTGISLVVGLAKLFLRFVLGLRRRGRLVFGDGELRVEETTSFAGRVVRSAKERFGRPDVLSARLETRYPFLPTLAGLTALGVGVIFGLLLLLDGIEGEFTPWILAGVGVLMAGVVLDLVLTAVASSLPGQTTVVLHLPAKRVIRLVGCDPEKAEEVVTWLHEQRSS
jgi:hypothetical protein